ncbi:ABC transporter substrate-binding protein [Paucibacter sp. B2R-40]|uniref:extracellular solute-binding protein n=1 Tax=Paucibacter sp. B2R-40 TaxID=2893554 RepID=UPI0021E39AA2|nr:extracellular solute-binding protein [Paucibacter sp. B2R-40]MCV2352569.1 ABC transporter substrate-binding protein [Paucibacter sp. B2R-40]
MIALRCLLISVALACCQAVGAAEAIPAPSEPQDLSGLAAAASKEGRLRSAGMPDTWANWRSTWADLKRLYGIKHEDENMNSAVIISRMAAEGAQASPDIGDVGFEYGAIARGRGISRPHKPAQWAQIPAWAKDQDGYWALAYTGTIAFLVNTRRTGGRIPHSWQELFEGRYSVGIGEVGSSAQSSASVLAAAIALGGDESNLQPALQQFAKLAQQGRLVLRNPGPARPEQAGVDVFLMWDFLALSQRDKLPKPSDYAVLIPADGSVTSGYTTVLNRHAPHPHAAELAREYIFSDAGQLNLAQGFARPIRIEHLQLPDSLRQRLLDSAQYKNARVIKPFVWAWEVKKLPALWQREVLARSTAAP